MTKEKSMTDFQLIYALFFVGILAVTIGGIGSIIAPNLFFGIIFLFGIVELMILLTRW